MKPAPGGAPELHGQSSRWSSSPSVGGAEGAADPQHRRSASFILSLAQMDRTPSTSSRRPRWAGYADVAGLPRDWCGRRTSAPSCAPRAPRPSRRSSRARRWARRRRRQGSRRRLARERQRAHTHHSRDGPGGRGAGRHLAAGAARGRPVSLRTADSAPPGAQGPPGEGLPAPAKGDLHGLLQDGRFRRYLAHLC